MSQGANARDEVTLASATGWGLVPLTPEYDPVEHGVYVQTLKTVIDTQKNVRNIALSGGYGVGKSSILEGLAKVSGYSERVLALSLPTLAPVKVDNTESSLGEDSETKTNRIQREIVKQLLYREDPSKMPASRFKRIESLSWWRLAGVSAVSAVVVTIVFIVTGWMKELEKAVSPVVNLGNWFPVSFFIVAALVVALVYSMSFGRVHIKELSVSDAAVTLGDGATSYFDQYLDEIIYFFQKNKTSNIIVFEDIDRFDDARIFESLRELNTLVNSSPKLRARSEPVRFIYATRDSIFDHSALRRQNRDLDAPIENVKDPAQVEVVRANRTKFFDLVIPVVPFISHQSAGDLALEALEDVERTDQQTLGFDELLDIAVRTLPEMRLLKNIRNEFVVFRDRIFSGEGEKLRLNDPQLFAMMIYKSTHLADFEAIRYQESQLDALYGKHRELVRESTQSTQDDLRRLRADLHSVRPGLDKSAQAGDALLSHVKLSAKEAQHRWSHPQFELGGSRYSEEDLKTSGFWSAVVAAGDDLTLTCYSGPRNSDRLSLDKTSVERAIGTSVDRALWDQEQRNQLHSEIENREKDLEFLRSADMADLMKREDFKVMHEGTPQPLAKIAEDLLNTKGLAYNLVKAGFIDSNFTLYTSVFHGRTFGPEATNFTIHNIKRNVMDEYFKLAPDDVAVLIKDKPEDALGEPVYYNVDILDYLLKNAPAKANVMIRSLGRYQDEQLRMLQAYLDVGANPELLVERLTEASEGTTSYLAEEAKLDQSERLKLMSVALANFADEMHYDVIDDYMADHYAELPVMTSGLTTPPQARRIVSWLEQGGFVVPELRPLGINLRREIIRCGCFDVTAENLGLISGDPQDLALDTVKAAEPYAFHHAVSNLDEYLAAVEDLSFTVQRPGEFVSTLSEVNQEAAPGQVRRVIANASPDCVVEALSEAPEDLWIPLALENRVRPTFANVELLIVHTDAANGYVPLSRLLENAQAIADVENVEEVEKEGVAFKLIEIPDELLSARKRASLIGSLNLEDPIADIPPETESEIYGPLVGARQLEDSGEMYSQLEDLEWSAREGYVARARSFPNYMTPSLVRGDLPLLFTSTAISDAVKERVFDDVEGYLAAASDKGLSELADYARNHDFEMPLSAVARLASTFGSADVVLPLLAPHLEEAAVGDLLPILRSLGGSYEKLMVVGRASHKLPDDPSVEALLEKLKSLRFVSSYSRKAGAIRVHMKEK